MADMLQKFVADKKDVVETVMEVFEQGAEVVASIAGDLFPVFSIAAPIVKLALDNVESKEAEYMRKQFQRVQERLEVMSEEIQRINDEVKKSGADAAYFSVEENLTNLFRKYLEILNAKPKFREAKKKQFMDHFSKTGGEKNLHILYNAVTGDKVFGESVLEITLNYEQKSRRAMEDFCARLKQLFLIGLIALMGYSGLKGSEDEEDLLKKWAEKMEVVQMKMSAVIEDCISSFPNQAEIDMKKLVRDNKDKSVGHLANMILTALMDKYNWVFWSVRVFNSPTGLFKSKKDFDCATGKSRFQVQMSDDKLNVFVSYSSSPEPLDKVQIQELVEGLKNPSIKEVAELLFEKIPACVIHTIKIPFKDVAHEKSFKDELYFTGEYKRFCLFVHPA